MNYENADFNQENYQNEVESIPMQYRPLSPWAYLGYNILFVLPIIGLIFLIIFSFNNNNIARRNYARSFFCAFAVSIILTIVLTVFAL
ncbi:MAG: ABC transporter permease [Clostridia bacterium]|nr:ABC transporter permease [Clostridia bacterium]